MQGIQINNSHDSTNINPNQQSQLEVKIDISDHKQDKLDSFITQNDQNQRKQSNVSFFETNMNISKATHKKTCFFTIIFKVSALSFYLIFYYLIPSSIVTFLSVVILSAIDFWTIKNISGRLLVGLRWNHYMNKDGTQEWIFESLDPEDQNNNNSVDSFIFWFSQIILAVIWMIISLLNLIQLRLFWLIPSLFSFVLICTNLVGFYKCRGEHQNKLQSFKKSLLESTIQ